jgi:hypothetical protein
MAALVAAISVGEGAPFPIEMAGTRPAMTLCVHLISARSGATESGMCRNQLF